MTLKNSVFWLLLFLYSGIQTIKAIDLNGISSLDPSPGTTSLVTTDQLKNILSEALSAGKDGAMQIGMKEFARLLPTIVFGACALYAIKYIAVQIGLVELLKSLVDLLKSGKNAREANEKATKIDQTTINTEQRVNELNEKTETLNAKLEQQGKQLSDIEEQIVVTKEELGVSVDKIAAQLPQELERVKEYLETNLSKKINKLRSKFRGDIQKSQQSTKEQVDQVQKELTILGEKIDTLDSNNQLHNKTMYNCLQRLDLKVKYLFTQKQMKNVSDLEFLDLADQGVSSEKKNKRKTAVAEVVSISNSTTCSAPVKKETVKDSQLEQRLAALGSGNTQVFLSRNWRLEEDKELDNLLESSGISMSSDLQKNLQQIQDRQNSLEQYLAARDQQLIKQFDECVEYRVAPLKLSRKKLKKEKDELIKQLFAQKVIISYFVSQNVSPTSSLSMALYANTGGSRRLDWS